MPQARFSDRFTSKVLASRLQAQPPQASITAKSHPCDPGHANTQAHFQPLRLQRWYQKRFPQARSPPSTNFNTSRLRQRSCSEPEKAPPRSQGHAPIPGASLSTTCGWQRSGPTLSRRRPRPGAQAPPTYAWLFKHCPISATLSTSRPRPIPGVSLSTSRRRERPIRPHPVEVQAPPRLPGPALSARRARMRVGRGSSSPVLCVRVAADSQAFAGTSLLPISRVLPSDP